MAECNYREVVRQLKEQFIHGLNDKSMLDEVIRELMAKNNREQTMSKDVSGWARRIKAQWAQETLLSHITESQKFDKVKMVQKTKGRWDIETMCQAHHKDHANIVGEAMCQDSVQHMERHVLDVGR